MSDYKGTVWIDLSPGVRAEVEYDRAEYQALAHDEETVRGRLTGRVLMTGKAVFDNEWGG